MIKSIETFDCSRLTEIVENQFEPQVCDETLVVLSWPAQSVMHHLPTFGATAVPLALLLKTKIVRMGNNL